MMALCAFARAESGVERGLAALALAAMATLPIAEIVLRRLFRVGVPGSVLIVQHLTLIVTFAGAVLAARSGSLLALSTASFVPARWAIPTRVMANAVGGMISAALAIASLAFVSAEFVAGDVLALGVPRWLVLSVMPAGYALVALSLALGCGGGWTAGGSRSLPWYRRSRSSGLRPMCGRG